MEIKNEDHARALIKEWEKKSIQLQRRDINLAIQELELNSMYYQQKGNDQGASRAERCIQILKLHLGSLDG